MLCYGTQTYRKIGFGISAITTIINPNIARDSIDLPTEPMDFDTGKIHTRGG
jgi:hypothetical protein